MIQSAYVNKIIVIKYKLRSLILFVSSFFLWYWSNNDNQINQSYIRSMSLYIGKVQLSDVDINKHRQVLSIRPLYQHPLSSSSSNSNERKILPRTCVAKEASTCIVNKNKIKVLKVQISGLIWCALKTCSWYGIITD